MVSIRVCFRSEQDDVEAEFELAVKLNRRPKSENAKENTIFIGSAKFHEGVLERLKGFADAIFSIVLTILVLQLKSPSVPADEDYMKQQTTLFMGLVNQWPLYVIFLVCVVFVSSFFISFHIVDCCAMEITCIHASKYCSRRSNVFIVEYFVFKSRVTNSIGI